MPRSRYDELHDRYQTILTTKSGTRYEILAAVVFATLEQDAVVIHDLDVVGSDTDVPHQIDVHVQNRIARRRVLIECKDYDVRGAPVGLAVVRDFWGVVDDVHPDDAWIVTCKGFTKRAMQYAKGKGIKLATLRIFEDGDWLGRIHTVGVGLTIVSHDVARVAVLFNIPQERQAEFNEQMQGAVNVAVDDDPTQLFDGVAVRALSSIVQELARVPVAGGATEALEERETPEGWISIDQGVHRFPIDGYRISIPLRLMSQQITIAVDRAAARLLLSDGAGVDFVLWEHTLQGNTIDDAGAIHLAPADKQAILQNSVTTGSP
jgi:hypothetical protein